MEKLRIKLLVLLALAMVSGPMGCGDDDDDVGDAGGGGSNAGKGGDGGGGSSGKGGASGKGGSGGEDEDDGGPGGSSGKGGTSGKGGSGGSSSGDKCPALEDRTETVVSSNIDADATWSCDKLYILSGDLIFITGDSTLTIEAGTVIQGDLGSALVSTRGSTLITKGTAAEPVVFTSSAAEGKRAPGDWGGVVMLGSATLNIGEENRVEGIPATDDHGLYGGKDDKSSCGSLKYTRIEYAGFELSQDNELNGLTLGGCGSETTISYVQVHRGNDDGIEIFGGSPRLDHIVLTANADDGLDSDLGNTALVQFLVIQQDPAEADSAFEWNNQTMGDEDAEPRSSPTVYNATLVGTAEATGAQNGMVLRGGTAGIIRNVIITGFPVSAIDVRDVTTVNGTDEDPPILTVENSLFFENAAADANFEVEATTDGDTSNDDMGFVEEDFFSDAARKNVFDKDPKLGDAFSLTAPDFVPAKGSPAATGAATPADDGFFDTSAKYIGAFEPGGDDWSADWTTHAKN